MWPPGTRARRNSSGSRCFKACWPWAGFRRSNPCLIFWNWAPGRACSPPRTDWRTRKISARSSATARRFHVQALIVGETSGSRSCGAPVRNSMGTIFDLPIVETPSLVQSLRELRERGVVASPRIAREGRTLSQADFTGDSCILFGSEGSGISPAALGVCDEAVAIPMPPTVDSLNVGPRPRYFSTSEPPARPGVAVCMYLNHG